MYTIFALTAPRASIAPPEERLRQDMKWLMPLARELASTWSQFKSLGLISKDAQSWIDAKIAEYESNDDGIPEGLIAEFDRISTSDRVSLLRDPVAFEDLILKTILTMRADGYDGNRITAGTADLRVDGSLTRVDYDTLEEPGTLAIELPMLDNSDLWFSDADVMRDLLGTILRNVPGITWLCSYPTMYVGRQKFLFRDRRNFGWMGFSAKSPDEKGPLYAIKPLNEGSFLQLKPAMMTLHAEDVGLCNEAEAFLSDKNILPLR